VWVLHCTFALLAQIKVTAHTAFVANTNNWMCITSITSISHMHSILLFSLLLLVMFLEHLLESILGEGEYLFSNDML
jgi:hypothetical protein